MKKLSTTEILKRTPVGGQFFTADKDTMVGSYAARAGVKVQTERLLCIHAPSRTVIDVTRVTVTERLVDDDEPDPPQRRRRSRT